MRRPRHWQLWLPLVTLLALLSGLVAAPPAAAANNGIPVSNGTSNNNRPALAVSPDGSKACVAWALFDVNQDAYVRVYDRPTNTWTPPLSAPAVNVSQSPGESSSTARCTFDGAGNLHVVWLEGTNPAGSSRVQHRMVAAGVDPGQLGNWSPIATVSTESDEQWPDVAAQFSDPAGRLWLTYTVASGSGFTILARSWTPQGWSGATQVASADGQYSRVAVDDAGYVHVIYGSRSGERYTYRDVNSGAWSPDVQVPGADKPLAQTGIAVNRATGDVHIVYNLLYADANRVVNYVRKNGATGAAFTGPITIAAGDRFNVSRIAAAPNGRLTVVTDGAGGGSALAFATSADNGATWSSPTVFTDGSVKAQWPWVAEDATGNAYVAYWNGFGDAIHFVALGGGGNVPPPQPPPPPPAPTVPPAGPPFTPWNSLGGILTDAPAATSYRGLVYVFAKGSDNALYMKSSMNGSTFSPWYNLGGVLTAAPTATSYNGRLYVFARGTNTGTDRYPIYPLYAKWSDDGVNFTDWVNLGGNLTAPPAASSTSGSLYVLARGTDHALYYKRSTDGVTFNEWVSLGGILTDAPAAASFQDQMYVFAKGSDDALYFRRGAGPDSFTAWQSLGGILTAAPAAASYTPPGGVETLYTFANGTDNTVYLRSTTDGVNYTEWGTVGGRASGPPAAAGVNGRLFLFIRWLDDNALWERHTE